MEQELNDNISYLKMEKAEIPTKMRQQRCLNLLYRSAATNKELPQGLGFTWLV